MRKMSCFIIFGIAIMFVGCGIKKIDSQKEENIEYIIVEEDSIPEQLKKIIVEKKEKIFQLAYKDGEDMYICVGYGKQPTGGYSIKVKEIYSTKNCICIDTTLIGPNENQLVLKAASFPYIVVKINNSKKTVIYNM